LQHIDRISGIIKMLRRTLHSIWRLPAAAASRTKATGSSAS